MTWKIMTEVLHIHSKKVLKKSQDGDKEWEKNGAFESGQSYQRIQSFGYPKPHPQVEM
ncbi:MAG: hypothetical protein R2784_02260 [Saprospiraceae bacterium]